MQTEVVRTTATVKESAPPITTTNNNPAKSSEANGKDGSGVLTIAIVIELS